MFTFMKNYTLLYGVKLLSAILEIYCENNIYNSQLSVPFVDIVKTISLK